MFLVTGANGFIGSALVRLINEKGFSDIICADTITPRERPEPLRNAKYSKFIPYPDFLNWCEDAPVVDRPKAIFHMGAISSTAESDWSKLCEHNIDLSKTLFKYASQWNIPFIYASSAAVYGDGQLGFSDQTDTARFAPLNLYGKSKKEFDLWALNQSASENSWHGLRFFNVYGPNEYHKDFMASVAYKAFLQIQSTGCLKLFKSYLPTYKDGEQLRDFVYIKDITEWIWQFFLTPIKSSGIYNLGYGEPRSWKALADAAFSAGHIRRPSRRAPPI